MKLIYTTVKRKIENAGQKAQLEKWRFRLQIHHCRQRRLFQTLLSV